jgi:hypothetical protein
VDLVGYISGIDERIGVANVPVMPTIDGATTGATNRIGKSRDTTSPNYSRCTILGYTVEELNAFYDALGVEGCQLYIAVATWDLFPSMISYTVCLGAFLTLLARQYPGLPDNISVLAIIVWILDIIETGIQRLGCIVYPDRLPDQYIRLASRAVQWKWILATTSTLLVIVGCMHSEWKHFTVSSNKKQQ